VAMVITLILLAGVSQIFLSSKKSYTVQESLGRMQENGRYALETVVTDLRRAGYYGGNADLGKIIDNTPAGLLNGSRTATETGQCTSGNTDWVRMLESPIFGKNDNRTNYGCLPADNPHVGDILVVRYAAPWVVGGITTASYSANQYYIRSSLFDGRLFLGSAESNAANDIPGAALLRTSELVANAYFIHTSANSDPDKCPGSAAVPSLYRLGVNNGVLSAEEIAYGVEQFQVRYGRDTNADGSVDVYVDAPGVGSPDWDEVIAARVWILMRSECPEPGYTHKGEPWNMGNIVNYNPADNYRRQLFTSTVGLRN